MSTGSIKVKEIFLNSTQNRIFFFNNNNLCRISNKNETSTSLEARRSNEWPSTNLKLHLVIFLNLLAQNIKCVVEKKFRYKKLCRGNCIKLLIKRVIKRPPKRKICCIQMYVKKKIRSLYYTCKYISKPRM